MMASHYVAAPPRLGRFVVRGPHPKPCCSILSVPPPPWMLCCDQGPHCKCVCECEHCTLPPSIRLRCSHVSNLHLCTSHLPESHRNGSGEREEGGNIQCTPTDKFTSLQTSSHGINSTKQMFGVRAPRRAPSTSLKRAWVWHTIHAFPLHT